MGGRGSTFSGADYNLTGERRGKVSPLITAGLAELRGNEADPESTLRRIDKVRFNDLTHEQLFVVDREGFVIAGYDGDDGSVSFPPEHAAEWQNHVVTHRHPDSFGGTFSPADIGCVVRYGWAEMEASGNEGRYNIRPTREAKGVELIQRLSQDTPALRAKMREVATEMSNRRQAMTREEFAYENRKRQVQVFDDWYAKHLPEHGYTYTFTPREEYENNDDTDT